jgi:hypothetical protein
MTQGRTAAITCDVSAVVPDLAAIDGLARLQLEARRAGLDIALQRPSRRLLALLKFSGLADALGVEMVRDAEEREERGGVEEEGQPDHPAP